MSSHNYTYLHCTKQEVTSNNVFALVIPRLNALKDVQRRTIITLQRKSGVQSDKGVEKCVIILSSGSFISKYT